jgi:basic membrane lipoprotein Med (substrate-binding protein (PBP1-ABC) superfamily)
MELHDMSAIAPKAHLASVIHNWGPYYVNTLKASIAGKPLKENVWGGMKEGMDAIVSLNSNIPASVKKEVEAKRADMYFW